MSGIAGQKKRPALGSDKIPGLITRFALTTLAALVFNSLYNLTDALFVSWGVGDDAMGGVSIVFPFTIIQAAIATAAGGGAASIVSRYLGEGRAAKAGEITLNAMAVFYITAAVITALGFIFMDPLLRVMGITDALYSYAKAYFVIILACNIFSTGFSAIIRAEGKMLYGLLIWVIPISINIILDAVFILGLGWGVTGSAVATVISQFISFAMSMLFFLRFSAQKFKGARLRWKHIGAIISIGLPSLVQMISLSVITMMINAVLSGTSGTLGINSFAYVSRLLTYLIIPFTAVSQALSPVAGYNYGAGNTARVKSAAQFSAVISLVYAVIITILTAVFGEYFLRMFTADAEILSFGGYALRIISASFIFTPLSVLSGALFQSTGKKIKPLIIFSAKLAMISPLIFTLPQIFGVAGIWWSYVISEMLAAVLAAGITAVSYKCGKKPPVTA